MDESDELLNELCDHLARHSALSRGEAARVVGDVLAFFARETAQQFVLRRHRELQRNGELSNEAIFALIQRDLGSRCFAAPSYSLRQIRRLIYG